VTTKRFWLSAGFALCIILLICNLALLASADRLTVSSGAGTALLHLYFSYYYLNRLAEREARLWYYIKTPKEVQELVGRDVTAALGSLVVLLVTLAYLSRPGT
jgi:hypothetical protein